MDDIMLPTSKPTETKPPEAMKTEKPTEKKKVKRLIGVLLALLLAAAAGGGVWYWQKTEKDKLQKKIDELTSELNELRSDSSGASGIQKSETDEETEDVSAAPSTETISEAISSKNYAALEGYMAETVNVIIAASEGLGPVTPAEAVEALDYLDNGTPPWDFNLPAATLTDWRTHSYATYVPVGAIIGQASGDGPVVSFQLNASGQITDIFMATAGEIMGH